MNKAGKSKLKVLVTGADGFVGRALVDHLHSNPRMSVYAGVRRIRNRHIPEVDNFKETDDLGIPSDLKSVLQDIGVVIHLAGRVRVLGDSTADPLKEFFRVNVGGTLNLAKQALETGVKRFIFISSVKVNGKASHPEQPFRSYDCLAPEDAYAISKRIAEVGFKKSFA